MAFVRTAQEITPPKLGQFCRQHIAGYKVPFWIGFVKEMPRNPMGKVQKFKLVERFA